MNYLWAYMILAGIVFAAFHGTLPAVTEAALASAKEAVSLCITMSGILAFWTGIMKIAEKAGMTEAMARKLKPVLKLLFPHIPEGHRAARYLAANITANLLGLGWAATPAGLKAMEALDELEKERARSKFPYTAGEKQDKAASDEMCDFLILNISSLQLIPVNIIAYRSQYGSTDPAGIIGPALAATGISTLAAVIFIFLRRFLAGNGKYSDTQMKKADF